MKIPLIYQALAAGTISFIALVSSVAADSRVSSQQIVDLVRSGEILSVLQLQEQYPALQEGRWLDIELEKEHGVWIYEIELINPADLVIEYKFNAVTGVLIEQEIDD